MKNREKSSNYRNKTTLTLLCIQVDFISIIIIFRIRAPIMTPSPRYCVAFTILSKIPTWLARIYLLKLIRFSSKSFRFLTMLIVFLARWFNAAYPRSVVSRVRLRSPMWLFDPLSAALAQISSEGAIIFPVKKN